MRLIGLVLTLSLILASLVAEAQPPSKVYRISLFHVGLWLTGVSPAMMSGSRSGRSSASTSTGTRAVWRGVPEVSHTRGSSAGFSQRSHRSGPVFHLPPARSQSA